MLTAKSALNIQSRPLLVALFLLSRTFNPRTKTRVELSNSSCNVKMSPLKGKLGKYNVANKLYKSALLNAVCFVAGISIFFFGYDQGLMGGVNTAKNYAELMGYGHWDEESKLVVVDKPLLQGGIVRL